MSIVSHQACIEFEQLFFNSYSQKLKSFQEFSNLIENVKAIIKISTHDKTFSKDFLQTKISNSDQFYLTIVSLFELIHFETKQEFAFEIDLVQKVVQLYMKKSRSIILAIIFTKNDYANQIVLKLARVIDKGDSRTLNVIMKIDILIASFESEVRYISLAKNQNVKFCVEWRVLKNMNFETKE